MNCSVCIECKSIMPLLKVAWVEAKAATRKYHPYNTKSCANNI